MRTRRSLSRRVSAVAAGLAAALCCAVVSLPATASPLPSEPQAADAASSGLAEFGACLAGHGSGSFVVLMDQSGSLRKTDPDKARVTAGHYLIDRLVALANSSQATLDVRVAGFAADYTPQGDWTAASPQSADALKQAISSVGDSLQSHDTDYWNALEGARGDLAGHDSSGCRAIAWFSDGEYDLDVRADSQSRQRYGEEKGYAAGVSLASEDGVAQAEQTGLTDLCRATGVADQVRSAGVVLIGIGLSSGQTDFTVMQRVATAGGDNAASAGVERCGDLASPNGAFYPVSDIDSLLMAFDAVSAAGADLQTREATICQGQVCQQGETAFVLDGALDEVHILATSSVDGLEAHLYTPGSDQALVIPGGSDAEQRNNGVVSRWITPRTLEISAQASEVSAWDGVWRLAFVDKSSASQGEQVRINLKLSSPVQLVWEGLDGQGTLRAGETLDDASFVLYDRPGGQPLDMARIKGPLKASVTLTDSRGKQVTLFEAASIDELGSGKSVTIPADVVSGQAVVTRSVTLTTPDGTTPDGQTIAGAQLAPSVATQAVTIEPPLNFPAADSAVSFPLLEKETSVTASLPVRGPGCVWLDADSVKLTGSPADAGKVTLSADYDSRSNCLKLGKGEKDAVTLTLTAAEHANGAVSGSVDVMLAPDDDPAKAQPMAVKFSGEMRRPLNVQTATAAFVIALLAGLGLPLGLLYLLKFLSARIPSGTLVIGRTVVEVPEDGSAPQVTISSDQLTQTSIKRSREISVGGVVLRAHPGLAPTSVPQVRLDEPATLSVSGALGSDRRGRAILPLNVRGNWFAMLDQPDSPRHVSVVVITSSISPQVIDRMCADVSQRLRQHVTSLAKRHADVLEAKKSGSPSAGGSAAATTPATSVLPGGGVAMPTPPGGGTGAAGVLPGGLITAVPGATAGAPMPFGAPGGPGAAGPLAPGGSAASVASAPGVSAPSAPTAAGAPMPFGAPGGPGAGAPTQPPAPAAAPSTPPPPGPAAPAMPMPPGGPSAPQAAPSPFPPGQGPGQFPGQPPAPRP